MPPADPAGRRGFKPRRAGNMPPPKISKSAYLASLIGDAAWLNYAILAQEHRCGELVEVDPADIKGYRATGRTTKKGMRL